jgi:hypothetical protein
LELLIIGAASFSIQQMNFRVSAVVPDSTPADFCEIRISGDCLGETWCVASDWKMDGIFAGSRSTRKIPCSIRPAPVAVFGIYCLDQRVSTGGMKGGAWIDFVAGSEWILPWVRSLGEKLRHSMGT